MLHQAWRLGEGCGKRSVSGAEGTPRKRGLNAPSAQANENSKARDRLERASNRLQSSLDPVLRQASQAALIEQL